MFFTPRILRSKLNKMSHNLNIPFRIERIETIHNHDYQWDTITTDYYQTSEFLSHLESYNKCDQRYYQLFDHQILKAAAVVYNLAVNMFTFSGQSFKVKMSVIGIPASVDSSGVFGEKEYLSHLIFNILEQEKGIILALNYAEKIEIPNIVQMETLPSLILNHTYSSFVEYLNQMRHHYRRKVLKATQHFDHVLTHISNCTNFTEEHYQLYLNIIERTKTKLETLSISFFQNLPANFQLTDYRDCDGKMLSWHITCQYKEVYYFLFGGINYLLRDTYSSYFNNLIGIVKEGIESGSKTINLGQTAEVPKSIIGAKKVKKMMFVYHKNYVIRYLFKIFKGYLTYKSKSTTYTIFK